MNKITLASLSLLVSLSLLIILQVDIGAFPLIEARISADRAQKINVLASDLSQGVIISTLFYCMLVLLPAQAKSKKIKSLIQPRLNIIVQRLEISILYLANKAGKQCKKVASLQKKDLSSISKLTTSKMTFCYQISYNSDSWVSFSTGQIDEIVHFEKERELVVRIIDEILELPHILDENDGLVDILPRLRDSSFYVCVKSYAEYGPDIVCSDLTSSLDDYLSYFLILKRLSTGVNIRITPQS